MNKRIEEIRKSCGLSRVAFGSKLGVSGDVINNLERGRVEVKEHMIILICREFGVNEKWLRYGEGEMLVPKTREDDIAELTLKILADEEDSFRSRLVSALAKLSEEQWELLADIADKITKKEQD